MTLAKNETPAGRSSFWRSGFRHEVALILLIKLALVLSIKFVFINDPVSEIKVEQRMDAVFSTHPIWARPAQLQNSRSSND